MPSLTAMIGTTFLIVLWQGGYRILYGQMSLGALITFNTYLNVLVWPMIALGWVTNIFQRGAASMGRLNYILRAKTQVNDRDAKLSAETRPEGNIEFRNLNFKYPTTLSGDGAPASNGHAPRPVLRNINLTIPAGSTLAIVGPTGSGKTTLAALVARLWEVPAGELLLDGHAIREWPLESLRRAIGYVPQDTFLFSETVGENIAFGVPEHDPLEVQKAAEIASLHGDVEGFTKSYETMVGERGITLSGGQ